MRAAVVHGAGEPRKAWTLRLQDGYFGPNGERERFLTECRKINIHAGFRA
jgi:hypothetical protein